MQIHVGGKNAGLASEFQAEVAGKMESALSRFSSRIGKVNAYLEDLNGPKSGLDKCLRLTIDVKRLPLVVIEEKGDTWRKLIDQAADRAAHTVSRQVARRRSRGNRTSMAGETSQALDA